MRLLDGHIHVHDGEPQPEALLESMSSAGIEEGVLLSLPLFWIDPTERDASSQVARAVEEGVRVLKLIHDRNFERFLACGAGRKAPQPTVS